MPAVVARAVSPEPLWGRASALVEGSFARPLPVPGGGFAFTRTSLLFDQSEPLPHVHHIMRVDQDGFRDLTVGRSRNLSGRGFSGPEHSFGALPSDDGFITVMLAAETQVVRKIGAAGETIWRQVELPPESQLALGMVRLDSGFALLTSSQLPQDALGTTQWLLWFDAEGNVTGRMAPPYYGSNVRPSMLGLSGGRVALAGVITSFDASLRAAHQFVDLVVLRLAADASLSGHRVLNESPLTPFVLGMAVDVEDTVYVTSVTGTRQTPRGLICALPDQGDGTCYLAPDGVSPLAISAPAPRFLYALSDEALVKLELPAP